MATRKKPKKLTKASVKKMLDATRGMKFVASDPKDEPQAEGVNRFTSEWRSWDEGLSEGVTRKAQSDPKSPWMKLREALDLMQQAEAEMFQAPLVNADDQILAIRCRRYLRSAQTEVAAAAEVLEWVNHHQQAHLDHIRHQHNVAVGGRCLEPADLATSTWFHADSFALATDKDD